MTGWTLRPSPLSDTPALAALRAASHGAGTAACIALLTFAATLTLETVPSGPEREDGFRGLGLAARLAGGEPVDPAEIVTALMNEHSEGIMIQSPVGPRRTAGGGLGHSRRRARLRRLSWVVAPGGKSLLPGRELCARGSARPHRGPVRQHPGSRLGGDLRCRRVFAHEWVEGHSGLGRAAAHGGSLAGGRSVSSGTTPGGGHASPILKRV